MKIWKVWVAPLFAYLSKIIEIRFRGTTECCCCGSWHGRWRGRRRAHTHGVIKRKDDELIRIGVLFDRSFHCGGLRIVFNGLLRARTSFSNGLLRFFFVWHKWYIELNFWRTSVVKELFVEFHKDGTREEETRTPRSAKVGRKASKTTNR